MLSFRYTVLLLLLLSVSVVTAFAADAQNPAKSLVVPKVDAPPKVDGVLDDACWTTAAKGDGFLLRTLSKPATEQTEFYVCYDSKAIYFAFYCHDSHPEKIKATQTERDSDLRIDDCVQIYLDTYHDHRTAEEFFVNPLGTQRDERKRGTADKISWKGDWHAAAKRVADGWTAEMEIPWAILNYKAGAASMGLNIRRDENRLGEISDWNDLNDGDQVMLYGDLTGLVLPQPPKKRPQIMPYVLSSLGIGGSKSGKMGLDVKQMFGEDNTFLFTAFPDFGTIEQAVQSIDFSYTAHRYSDNRPFFQEASSIFSSTYMYTTGIPDFDYGSKVFGKRGNLTYGLMGCSNAEKDRLDSMAVLIYDFPSLTRANLSVVGRDDGEVNNKVIALKISGQPSESASWWVRSARSYTAGAEHDGADLDMGLSWESSRWYMDASYGHVSQYFNPANGYVDYPGSYSYDIGCEYNVDQPGKSIRAWGFDTSTDRIWDGTRGTIEGSSDFGGYISLANHTSYSLSYDWGPHILGYDEPDEPPTPPYTWVHDTGYSASYSFCTDDIYRSGSLSYRWGRTAGGPSRTISFNCGFLPMKRFSTGISLRHVRRTNLEEGDFTGWLGILSAKYELTAEKSIAARVLLRHSKGTDPEDGPFLNKGTNLTLSYRQRVRQGLDIFALFGDYNVDNTVSKFSIKAISTL